MKQVIGDNILKLRKIKKLSQEAAADLVGVSRQTIAKWESGESIPDIVSCNKLAEILDVSLDDLMNFDEEQVNLRIPPKGKYMFGTVRVGEKGQIVIPVKARKIFGIKTGDDLLVVGDIEQGLAIMKTDMLWDALKIMGKPE